MTASEDIMSIEKKKKIDGQVGNVLALCFLLAVVEIVLIWNPSWKLQAAAITMTVLVLVRLVFISDSYGECIEELYSDLVRATDRRDNLHEFVVETVTQAHVDTKISELGQAHDGACRELLNFYLSIRIDENEQLKPEDAAKASAEEYYRLHVVEED